MTREQEREFHNIEYSGSPHHLDYVQVGDEEKRRKLRSLGYRIVVIKGEDVEEGISELANRIG